MIINPSEYKILIVDDVLSNVLLLQAILKKEGFGIETASNGLEALSKVKSILPDLILLDVMMPEMDGYEVAARLQDMEIGKEIPIIFLTALNDTDSIVKGFRLGANDYLTKPFRKEELVIRIRYQLHLLEAKRTILKQQLELKQVIAGRDKLYSVISHDLRSPVGSIKMMNNVILKLVQEEPVSADLKDMVKMVNKTSEEVYGLLDNLLKWTKNQLGSLKIARQKVQVKELFADIADIYMPIATQKGVNLAVELPEDIEMNIDIEMVKSIIRNLISNAVKFSYENGQITLSCLSKDDGLEIKVADNGKGITPENQEKLLKETSHFTTYGTGQEKGSGLGLLLCRDFAELHGGRLWFESIPGKETVFYVYLPF